jgi:carboxyl-terminal processing protease
MMQSPSRRSRRRFAIVGGLLAALVIFAVGVLVGGHPQATGLNQLPSGARGVVLGAGSDSLITDIQDQLKSGYYIPVNSGTLDRSSIDGMLAALDDPYTYYLDPQEFAAMQQETQGLYVGVGIQVLQRGSDVVIANVFPESPAQKAGIAKGDVLTAVDGRSMVGASLNTVTNAIRGPQNSAVVITVRGPSGITQTARMTRTVLKLQLVTTTMLTVQGHKIGVINLLEFDQGAASAVRTAVAKLTAAGATGLVLDLRGNPGGLVEEAVGLVGIFVPKGSPVVTTVGLHDPRQTLKTTAAPATTLPMVVLVDRYSASASEIVSGALRDDGRAILVGERTFGKAVVQETVELPNQGALHFTIARYLTPQGVDLNHKGLTPNIVIATSPTATSDPALQRAAAAAAAGR